MKNKKIVFAGMVVSALMTAVLSTNSANASFWNWFKAGDDNVAAVASAATTTATIKVVSPNGGEVWKAGTKKKIVFKGDLIKEPFAINLRGVSRGTDSFIGSGVTSGNGKNSTFSWDIPATTETGNDYKILVRYTSESDPLVDYEIYDESDKTFTIKNASSSSLKSKSSSSRSSKSSSSKSSRSSATTTKSYLLKIIKSGEGSVTDEQRQIICGTGCKGDSGSYIAGSEVKLTAVPNGGYVFEKFAPEKECPIVGKGGMGGDAGTDTYTVCQTIMNKNKTITAVFKKIPGASSPKLKSKSSSLKSKSSSSR